MYIIRFLLDMGIWYYFEYSIIYPYPIKIQLYTLSLYLFMGFWYKTLWFVVWKKPVASSEWEIQERSISFFLSKATEDGEVTSQN